MTAQRGFWMLVTDPGGGMVTGIVRRDTTSYPEKGANVFVSGSGEHDPDIDLAHVTVRLDDLDRLLDPLADQEPHALQEAEGRLQAAVDAAPREALK